MIRQAQHTLVIEYGRLIARVSKKRKDRMALITSQLEVIVSHCLKLHLMSTNESKQHWLKEIAIAFLNISKVRKPNGNNEDMERITEWTSLEVTPRELRKEVDAIELEYNINPAPRDNIGTLIFKFIINEYENILYDDDWTLKSVYDNKHLKQICKGNK